MGRNVLFLDTASNKEITIGIEINGRKDEIIKILESHRDQVVLPLILELLQKHGLQLRDLHEITVVTGPGSFTGLRVGVAVANALGYALQIPVNGSHTPVEPIYS
ncbi:MAG: tRNA (adenosine(37)-N6)-threonylcarbamoyltransferase complex dimerization subunit type 1 TsaB [Patescibacteria group bacterium]|nr:tRNA (adenosine(37)-N6)-threonylcarbamoyltransferase complex dimerization subunit type 1 TsaB [Patescibacteria group bacterium]